MSFLSRGNHQQLALLLTACQQSDSTNPTRTINTKTNEFGICFPVYVLALKIKRAVTMRSVKRDALRERCKRMYCFCVMYTVTPGSDRSQ